MNYRAIIPPDTLRQLDEYQNNRVPPGSFLHAVLANDLYRAIRKADEANTRWLAHIAAYVEGHMPTACRGSQAAVQAWLHPLPPPLDEPCSLGGMIRGDTFVFADDPDDTKTYVSYGGNWYGDPDRVPAWPHRDDGDRPVLIKHKHGVRP